MHVQGCIEHYLVHTLRTSRDFIHDLNFVILENDQIIGNIMYTKSFIESADKEKIETVTFGPVSILPEFQRKGFGSKIIEYSMNRAREMGFNAVIIYGHPSNYCKHGFCGSKKYQISTIDGKYPCALLAKPLKENVFGNKAWYFHESEAYNIDEKGFADFDSTFEQTRKEYRYTQEEFYIYSHSYLE